MKELGEQIQRITEDAGGTWGISIYDLNTKKTWSLNEQERFYAASVIKVPIMIAVFAESHRGEIKLSDTLQLKREDIVAGSGVLQHMTPQTELTIYDLVTLMIIQSDNTATNMLIDLIGVKKVQETMKDIGLEKSKFYHKMMIQDVAREGFNEITANEMTDMLVGLAKGKIISVHACEEMIAILKKQQIKNGIPAAIPSSSETIIGSLPEWEIAHKTGNVSGVRHDVGIFYVGKRKLAASILTKGLDDLLSPSWIGKVGFQIYHYLKLGN